MKKYIFNYDDDTKLFKEKVLSTIPHFADLNEENKHEMIFAMRHENFEKGSIIFQQDEKSTAMFIVESGCVELYVS